MTHAFQLICKLLLFSWATTVLLGKDDTFWTPIDIDMSANPLVSMCKLNFQQYTKSPHSYPMFKDLVSMSSCNPLTRRSEKLNKLLAEMDSTDARYISPTAFIFHESRVGSTLTCNTLGTDPKSLVFSESTPVANALRKCSSCTREQSLRLFRGVVKLMGRTNYHERLFFKFQSIKSTFMDFVLEVALSLTASYKYFNVILNAVVFAIPGFP